MNIADGWSHLRDIEGSESQNLAGKLVVVAVSASVAALEIHRVARGLMRQGARVQFFLTPTAHTLVSPTSLEWATGFPVISHLTGRCEHLEFFGHMGRADLLVLAPATANTIAKVAQGLDDNAVTTAVTTALGSKIPVLCCPGMHEPMLNNPAVARNLAILVDLGVEVLEPQISEGKAKMMSADEIVARVSRRLGPGDLTGRRVLLTGGPTREYLDPARCLTNPSSGLSACLLAQEAYRRGADVDLVYGPGRVRPASWIRVHQVETSEDMRVQVVRCLASGTTDFALAVAAVSDFQPEVRSPVKLATEDHQDFQLRLRATPKILDEIRRCSPQTKLVAFKASSFLEDEQLEGQAARYLQSQRADWVVVNSVVVSGLGFDSEDNRYLVCSSSRTPEVLGPASKKLLAQQLWDRLLTCS